MGLGYRKSKNLGGGSKLNVGKGSIGVSSGVRGARVGVNSKRQARLSLSIPGTGFHYRKVITSKKKGTGFIAAIVNFVWWLMVACVWLCCMIILYFWKFLVFVFKKIAALFRGNKAAENERE